MEAAQAELLRETVTIAPLASVGVSGDMTWGSPVSYPCRIETETKYVRTTAGFELVQIGKLFIDGGPSITAKDKVTLPDGAIAVIGSIDTISDENGAVYYTRLTFTL